MAEAKMEHGDPLKVDHTPSVDVAAGEVVVLGAVPFVAHVPIPANTKGALAAGGGVYRGTPAAAIAGGVKVYWDDTANQFTATATSNSHFGYAVPDGSNGTTHVDVIHAPAG